jgi:predicted acetyltransferase
MPEEIIRYLNQEEKVLSRPVYETVFSEDSRKFVDYYYQYKTRDNAILSLWKEEELVSMVHLNPYTMIVNGYEVKSNYIVAVATLKDHRHQGYMRMLLERALNDMADQEMPFTFLMPASVSIYAPFDFVWICPYTELSPRVKQMDADGQNRYLAARYQMFCKRDARYVENWKAEQQAEEGELPLTKIPPFMARITDVCGMLQMVRSSETKTLYLHVKDPIIEKNNGYFCWASGPESSVVEKLSEEPESIDLELSIGELASIVFHSFRICLSEMV